MSTNLFSGNMPALASSTNWGLAMWLIASNNMKTTISALMTWPTARLVFDGRSSVGVVDMFVDRRTTHPTGLSRIGVTASRPNGST
jgi:hypothetical protein